MKNLFTTVKAAVTTRQAAEYYGLKVSRNGMTCCPFHDDRNPSMKVDERYYCFGCHETGDVIDFTAKLFGLTAYEAAKKLAYDFNFDPNTPTPAAAPLPGKQLARQRDLESHCVRVLTDYEHLLKAWKERYAPAITDEDWDPRFVEACQALPTIENDLDLLYALDEDLRKDTAESLIQSGVIDRLESILQAEKKEVTGHAERESRAA